MKILFISSTRLGDAVLSTGLLDYLGKTYPNSEITVAAGKLGMGLFEQFPNVIKTIPMVKQPYKRHWVDLWKQCIGTKWDIIVDIRSSAIPYLVRAKQRYIWNKKGKQGLHKVEQMAKIMDLNPAPSPTLYFSKEVEEKAKNLLPHEKPIIAIGPTANWIGKTWHAERFIELIQRIRNEDGKFKDAPVAIFAAPGEERLAEPVLQSIESDKRIDLIGRTSPLMAAAIIKQCDLYIGNDSGLMHCAGAVGVPTLGLFGPTDHTTYSPWGKYTHHVTTNETMDELIGYEGFDPNAITENLMDSLTVDKAYAGYQSLMKKVN